MAFAGLRGTSDWATDERPKNFREMILWREPNGEAPLTALLSKMKSEATDDPEFAWFEEEQTLVRVQMDATGASATSTAFGLGSGGLALVAGDVLLVEKADSATYDNELVLVSSVTSDTAIVVKRAQAGTTGANTGASAFLTKIGNVFAEGTNSPDVSSRNPTKVFNYCQIFKTAYELTRTAKGTKLRTGDPLKNDKKRRMFDHSTSLEKAFMWGVKHEDTGDNGKPRRWTGGIRSFISTNATVFATSITIELLMDAVSPVFDYTAGGGGNQRIGFIGNGALNAINKQVKGDADTQVQFGEKIKFFGMEFREFIMPQGTLMLKTHPLLNTHGRYTNSMFVINPAAIIYRHFQDTMSQDNIQAPDADTQKGQWLTEAGLELQHERSHAYLGNIAI